jgi:predicted NUDIX family NTP pyrophosphohydrolase
MMSHPGDTIGMVSHSEIPMKQSAGTLLYRKSDAGIDVLIVHPSGAYNRHKPWSIPKGIPDQDEELEAAARRETVEETGVTPGDLVSLGHIDYQKSGKRIHCFAGTAPDTEPRCASWEIDQARFVGLEEARRLLHPDQRVFVDRLEEVLNTEK